MNPLTRTGRWMSLAAAAGLVAWAGVPWADAQIAAGGNGRARDANPQVGSGGTNSVQNQVDYQARNDLITGNVAGGFGFQDAVGYGAIGAFQDSLGSDDLFAFRAASLASAPAVANLQRYQGNGRNTVVFSGFTTIPQNRQAGTTTRFAPESGVFRINPAQGDRAGTGLTLNTRTNTLNNRFGGSTLNTIGVLRVPDGSSLAVTADPLLGVRRRAIRPLSTPVLAPATPYLNDDGQIAGLPSLNGEVPTNAVSTASFLNSPGFIARGSADNTKLTTQQRSPYANASGQIKPTLQLGQIAANPATTGVATIEKRVEALQASIFGPPPQTTPAPGAPNAEAPVNAYTQLLDEIRAQARQATDEQATANTRDARPAWMKALEDPSKVQLDAAENSLEATLERIRRSIAGDDGQDPAVKAGDDDEAQRRTDANKAFDSLMDNLTYNVRLETLAADRKSRLNDLFRKAEEELAAGHFLNAERTYRQVRVEATDNPLGLAGLIHAQLGAGMVRSAAFNLRSLFEQHPELVATRYGQNLLPPTDRLEWLQAELQRMIDSDNSSLDPGLMMAYLGYQVESRQLVRYGLAVAEDASPLDPLLPVLRRIWLDKKPAAKNKQDQPAQ